jgi:hypothetical protein
MEERTPKSRLAPGDKSRLLAQIEGAEELSFQLGDELLLALRSIHEAGVLPQASKTFSLKASTLLAASDLVEGIIDALIADTPTIDLRLRNALGALLSAEYKYGQAMRCLVFAVATRHLIAQRRDRISAAEQLIERLSRVEQRFSALEPEATAKILFGIRPTARGPVTGCALALARLSVACGAFGASRKNEKRLKKSFTNAWTKEAPRDADDRRIGFGELAVLAQAPAKREHPR